MSGLVTLVTKNQTFLSLVPIYIILPKYQKPAHTTLNDILIFNLSILTGLFFVIFSKMPFVIGKYVAFYLEKNFFPPLILNAMHGIYKVLKLR